MPPLTCPKCGTLIAADTTPQQKAGKARWKHTTANARRQAMSDLAKARWQNAPSQATKPAPDGLQ